jgi:hypothetical protein
MFCANRPVPDRITIEALDKISFDLLEKMTRADPPKKSENEPRGTIFIHTLMFLPVVVELHLLSVTKRL